MWYSKISMMIKYKRVDQDMNQAEIDRMDTLDA